MIEKVKAILQENYISGSVESDAELSCETEGEFTNRVALQICQLSQERVERVVAGLLALFRYAYTDGDWKDGELGNFLKQEGVK